jgi:dTDP-4-amino-4,6-dideoxygalactose transaminase
VRIDVRNEIAAYRVQFSDREIEEFLGKARRILSSGWLIPGVHNAELERRFAEFIGVSYVTTVASGTAALEIGFRCLGLGGAAVLVPANTNYATAEALLRAGGRPVLYDSDLYADARSIEAACTRDVAAVAVVHIGGYLAPCLPVIRRFCDERGLSLVEDASHAHGATLRGMAAGTFGDVAAFSLFATKAVTTAEGGMLVTGDARVAADSVRYRDQGKADDGVHHIVFGSA